MSDLGLALRQVRYEQKTFWRNPGSAVFTFAFPLLFLVIFATLNGSEPVEQRGGIEYVTFYVPGILAFGLIAACYQNLAIRLCVARDLGVLKRVRGTPVPAWAYLTGQLGSSLLVSVLSTALTLALGALVYDVEVRPDTLPGLLSTLAVGVLCFCALGVAVTALVPNGDAAPPVVSFSLFPLLFVSGIFFPVDTAPAWLRTFAELFPVQHLADGLHYAFRPDTPSPGVERTDLAYLMG